jgi:2-iminobutanoate/2-iminopropanoate deaminase
MNTISRRQTIEMIKTVSTNLAPQAIGPYSQAVHCGNLLYLSGQIPIDPLTNAVVEQDIVLQTKQVMHNIQAILTEAGLTLNDIAKTTIFVRDMNQFSVINEIYGAYMGEHRPARSTVEVSRLPKDVWIEIEAIAYIS